MGEKSSYLNVSMESFFRLLHAVDTSMIKLVDVIFGHFGEARLLNHPKINCGDELKFKVQRVIMQTIRKSPRCHRCTLLAIATAPGGLCMDVTVS